MLQIGWPAPVFKGQAAMPDGSIMEMSIADYRSKWGVLCFYPLDFTFVCPTELRGFNH
jgi:peroxiredoxin (alkyl hydroperoxide reductase subunit C)